MKRLGFTAVLAGLLAVSVVVATATAAGGATSEKRVIKVTFIIKTTRFQDKPPKSSEVASKGDVLTATGPLTNTVPQFGKKQWAVVGSMKSRGVFKNRTIAVITETTKLPGGTITAKGSARMTAGKSVLRIIKGTGAYKGAAGSVTGKQFVEGEWRKVYNIKLPGSS